MSKRRRTTGIQDKFYQDWCFIRSQEQAGEADREFQIIVPRPIQAPPAGRYYAIEVHSIEFLHTNEVRQGQHTDLKVALTFAPRAGHAAFLTGPGYPHNIWYYQGGIDLDALTGPAEHHQGSGYHKAKFTDDLGHGRLVTGEHIWCQVHAAHFAVPVQLQFAVQYTFTTVSCTQYAEHLHEIIGPGE